MTEAVLTRKLASIVAVDVAGYSAQTERDELATVAAVAALRQRIEACAAGHGGRVFNSAGDGFMLEFATVSSALEAGAAMADDPMALRIGVHVGEVSVLENGDLLGHGVNIAARLQQMARPRGVVTSEDVRRSVHGPLAARLVPAGSIKLDKMQETLGVYTLDAAQLRSRMQSLLRAPRTASALAAVALVAGIIVAGLMLAGPRPVRAAVFAFETPTSDAALMSLSEGVASEIVSSMNEIGMETISREEMPDPASALARARQLGAAFTVGGHVAREGDAVRVSVRLDDVRDRATIWSHTFEQPAAEEDGLRLYVSGHVVHVMRCAVEARREMPRLERNLMVLLLRSCAVQPNDNSGFEMLELARQLAAALPRSSLAQGRLAFAAARASEKVEEPLREQLRQEAIRAADLSLQIDRANIYAAIGKVWALRRGLSRADYERLLQSALRDAPEAGSLNTSYATLLRGVGRNEEAVVYARRAQTNNPLSPSAVYALGWALAVTGQSREASELLERHAQRWPGEDAIWSGRFKVSFWFGSADEALAVLAQSPADQATDEEARIWRLAVSALESGNAAQRRQAADAIAAQVNFDTNWRIALLAGLNDSDRAFAVAERMLRDQGSNAWWGTFFEPMGANLRRDPRFMPLMQRAGLIEYWRTSDRWPDFCAEPDLPYDCRAEAARLADGAD